MSTRQLVSIAARLRWRLTVNRLRKGGVPLFVLTVIFAVAAAVGGFATFVGARWLDPLPREALVTIAAVMVPVGWSFGPLLTGGVDETVDPTKLALLPLTTRQLATVTAAGGATSIGSIAAAVAFVGLMIGYAPPNAGLLLVAIAAATLFAISFGCARLLSVGLARAQRSRRGRDLALVASGVVGALAYLASQSIGRIVDLGDRGHRHPIVNVFRWVPTAWPARSILAAGAGQWPQAVGWLVASLALASAIWVLWARALERSLSSPPASLGAPTGSADRTAPLGSAASAFAASWAVQRRYLRRSPGLRSLAIYGLFVGVVFALVPFINGAFTRPDTSLAPFAGLLAMIGSTNVVSNVIGFDSGSLWIEALHGGPDRRTLVTRHLGLLPIMLAAPCLGIVGVTLFAGGWRFVPLAVLTACALVPLQFAAGSIASALAPVPYADGENPFSFRRGMSGAGCIAGLYAFAGMAFLAVLGAPAVLLTLFNRHQPWVYVVPFVAAPIYVGLWLWLARWLGNRLSNRAPRLLEELASRATSQ